MTDRLVGLASQLLKTAPGKSQAAASIPWDPDCSTFPTRKELVAVDGTPDGAAWVWGKEDFIGRLNLLTPRRVLEAKNEIRSGEVVPVNLPLNLPSPTSFGREAFQHKIKALYPGYAYDDLYTLNTQSGTQWDGFRHVGDRKTKLFYNGGSAEDWEGTNDTLKDSMHHLAEKGIAGRGVLLDWWGYANDQGIQFDPFKSEEISYDMLEACGKAQGLDIRPNNQGGDIRPGDMLFIRGGWAAVYKAMSQEQRVAIATDHPDLAGVKQEEKIIDWLHDSYFATVAGDMPAFEKWPPPEIGNLHGYLLPCWGTPIGKMLDLERLAAKCRERKSWFFFFTSAPANVRGGVSSHVNGLAIL